MNGLSDDAIGRLRAVANWPEFVSDRYSVTKEIGRGGMGTVYAAIDGALGREVALKVSNTVASAAFERRLAAEARVLASLEHPGIVPVHDVGRLADGRLFYVMKLVHGRTLREHLQHDDGHSDLSERLRIFERICEAVAFAHANRILHRDLKPDNAMVGSFGEVMVMDWGVARALASVRDEDQDPPGTVVGTHGFMAPEQARGEMDQLDERADVYGLGTILFALLTGRETPLAPGLPALAALAGFPSIPRPLRSICACALAADPVDRYRSASALGEDVARYRAGQAVAAHRESAVERATRIARVYRAPIFLVLAYMVMRALVAFTVGQ
jgi:serine/threonine protein kinase